MSAYNETQFTTKAEKLHYHRLSTMILKHISILNYKNIASLELDLSPNINCFVGANGMGKTNVLDAIYYLSFLRSSINSQDSLNIKHNEPFFMIKGKYISANGTEDEVSCSLKTGSRKRIKKNGKDIHKFSEHIGSIPLIMISPADSLLVMGGSEERRRFMDIAISQYDSSYLENLIHYEKTLKQRNAILKHAEENIQNLPSGVIDVIEEMMSNDAQAIYEARTDFNKRFLPIFEDIYAQLCNTEKEKVSIDYSSHISRGPLKSQLEACRNKEVIIGYTLHGTHKDDMTLTLNGYPIKREGSQGQAKTYFIALKLAQFIFLREHLQQMSLNNAVTPILLLDDIFDKLDSGRVSKIIDYASSSVLGQVFITDTHREHLDLILESTKSDYKLFTIQEGKVSE